MYERRPRGYPRRPGAKIYYPSGKSPAKRHSRFRRRNSDSDERQRRSVFSFGEGLLKKRFRPHSNRDGKKTAGKRFRAHNTSKQKQDEALLRTTESAPAKVPSEFHPVSPDSHAPVYSIYPMPPVFQPPPAPYPYGPYDHHGRRLSRQEIAELDARESYEDRYGRDFDRYSDSPSVLPSDREILPRNFLVESEDEQ